MSASRQQLLWLQVESPNAQAVFAALKALILEHGPPLVLKSDNGSAFIAAETLLGFPGKLFGMLVRHQADVKIGQRRLEATFVGAAEWR
jgi:hypothetical protein